MNFFKHFITITRHRHIVLRYCFFAGLYRQGLLHDLSKYSFTEFWRGVRYYAGGVRSPIPNERRDIGYSVAWLHHKGRNRHHSEYWVDLNVETGKYEPVPMPKRFIAESVLDRIAASYNYNRKSYTTDMPLEYLYRTKEKTPMHESTFCELERLLKYYRDNGERALFKLIKKEYRR